MSHPGGTSASGARLHPPQSPEDPCAGGGSRPLRVTAIPSGFPADRDTRQPCSVAGNTSFPHPVLRRVVTCLRPARPVDAGAAMELCGGCEPRASGGTGDGVSRLAARSVPSVAPTERWRAGSARQQPVRRARWSRPGRLTRPPQGRQVDPAHPVNEAHASFTLKIARFLRTTATACARKSLCIRLRSRTLWASHYHGGP